MKTIDELKVGDTVWWYDDANGRGRAPKESVITKVGSKLISIKDYGRDMVFRKDTMRANDAYEHERLIIDMESFEQEGEKRALVMKLQRANFAALSLDELRGVAKLLRVDTSEPT